MKATAELGLRSKRTKNNALAVQKTGQAQEIADKRGWDGIIRPLKREGIERQTVAQSFTLGDNTSWGKTSEDTVGESNLIVILRNLKKEN